MDKVYIWATEHVINKTISIVLNKKLSHAVIKDTSLIEWYRNSPNKFPAIAYGILRGTAQIFDINTLHNIDWFEVDRGYINPNHFDGYYRISRNGLQSEFKPHNYPDDRLKKLKYTRSNLFNKSGHILICKPTGFVCDYYQLNIDKWVDDIKAKLEPTGRRIIVRDKTSNTPLKDHLTDAFCVIVYNSNVALDATIAGIPAIAVHGVINGWTQNSLDRLSTNDVHVPSDNEIDNLLRFVSYRQFKLNEITSKTLGDL